MAMEPTANDATTPEAETPPEPMSTEQFVRDDPRALYARLRPDQRTAIAEEFARCFRLSADADAREKYGAELAGMIEPEQVAEMHAYARDHHPEILEQVMRHPVTQASLEAPGAKAEEINPEAEQAVGMNVPTDKDIPSKMDRGVPGPLP